VFLKLFSAEKPSADVCVAHGTKGSSKSKHELIAGVEGGVAGGASEPPKLLIW